MSTLSVPLPANLETFIESMVRRGAAANKAAVVRQALFNYAEEQAIAVVLKAEQEVKEGKALRGDIRKIMKRLS
jgi:Arc/MetJ-type ribon-helix-helix transcriptional regulator